ncbi:MAG: hypothetical protein HAW61_01340 [Candidatus Portiera sp.]|nr:hypothetical protein [Portiera sp.]
MKITEIGQIDSRQIEPKQRRFKKNERSIYERMLRLVATPILIMLLTSCGSSSGGTNPGPLRGEAYNPPSSPNPIDADGNGFIELWHPAHLLSLTDSYNGFSLSLNGSYELKADIGLAEYSNWRPIGNFTHPFTGKFDGRGFSITDISSIEYDYAGLFGLTDGASLSNLKIKKVDIIANRYAGSLAGYTLSTNISNVEVDLGMGQVIIATDLQDKTRYFAAGGLVGAAISSNLERIRVIGIGSVRSHGQVDGPDNHYASGGLAGLSSMSNFINTTLDAKLDIISGGTQPGRESRAGSLFGNLFSSSMFDTQVNFAGKVLVEGVHSHNRAGGLVGSMHTVNIHGLTASIHSSIISAPIEYIGLGNCGANVGGAFGSVAGPSEISDITIHLVGDVIANNTNNPSQSIVGGLFAAGSLKSAYNVNLLIDGDLIAIGSSNQMASIGNSADYLANISVVINGDLSTQVSDLYPIDTESFFGGITLKTNKGNMDNISIVINGDITTESSVDENTFSMMLDYIYKTASVTITNSYVLVNGSVNIFAADYSAIQIGGFFSENADGRVSVDNSYVHITGGVIVNVTTDDFFDYTDPQAPGDFGFTIFSVRTLDIGYLLGVATDKSSTNITNSYFAVDNLMAIYVDNILSPEHFDGVVGQDDSTSTSSSIFTNNTYYHLDIKTNSDPLVAPSVLASHTEEYRNYVQLRCPTTTGEVCGDTEDTGDTGDTGSTRDTSNLPTYLGWDPSKWDFGTTTDLPNLRR